MKDARPFLEKKHQPTSENLKAILKHSYIGYQNLIEEVKEFAQLWGHTSTIGWSLKVYDSRKALFNLIPMENAFFISLTIIESEKDNFIANQEMVEYHASIILAKKYNEGYHLQFPVYDQETYNLAVNFLKHLIELRK